MTSVETKKIFISYSWTSEDLKDWVLNLAKSLRNDGIDVILDRWDLKPGQDKFEFMEKMVNDPSVDRVLIICDRRYAEKANSRTGGVGTETQIITPEVYNDAGQTRFLPVIYERNPEDHSEYLPTFIKSRMYFDLSSEASYQEEYTRLIRDIYEKPDLRKPPLGSVPKFLLEDSIDTFVVENKAQEVSRISEHSPVRLPLVLKDFFDIFVKELDKLAVEKNVDETEDEASIRMINESLPYKKSLANVMAIVASSRGLDEIVVDFFEDFNNKIFKMETRKGNDALTPEAARFLLNESFIETIAIFTKYNEWSLIAKLVHHIYYDEKSREEIDFVEFRHPLLFIYDGKVERESKQVSIQATIMKGRAPSDQAFQEMVEADLFLYYISVLNEETMMSKSHWFPVLYLYLPMGKNHLKVFTKMKSRSTLKDILTIFDETENGFSLSIGKAQGERGYGGFTRSIPALKNFITTEEVGYRP